MENILVTIITPTYNSGKTVRRTIESVINQTYNNIEYIIIDGLSTDNTLNIVREYHDSRIKLISEKDSGIYNAMNKGIKLARGEIIGIINSDDWYEIDAIQYIINHWKNVNMQVHYGVMSIYEKDKKIKILLNFDNNLKNEMISHPTCFVSKSIYKNIGLFNENYKIVADYDFMIKVKLDEQVQFYGHEKKIACFRQGGISTNKKYNNLLNLELARLKFSYGIICKSQYLFKTIKYSIKYLLKL